MRRVIDLTDGVAMVITDIHGNWQAYQAYRDRFIALRTAGHVDRLIFCGDLIHSYGPANADYSLEILRDLMAMQSVLGSDVVIILLGNHELPHIYSLPLSRGSMEYTPRFEAALSEAGSIIRDEVIRFLDSLPFVVRTAAGVMINHCGASKIGALAMGRDRLMNFDHQRVLSRWEKVFSESAIDDLLAQYQSQSVNDYATDARYYLAVSGPTDPRYWNLLRATLYSGMDEDFSLLWEAFFTRNEKQIPEEEYTVVLQRFLATWSVGAPAPQNSLVTGHIPVSGGFTVVAGQQLRLASWAHANPREQGACLIFDCGKPVSSAALLTARLEQIHVSA